MGRSFYSNRDYRLKQSALTKANHIKGVYDHLKKRISRTCAEANCDNTFDVQAASVKKFCSQSCAARNSNSRRIVSFETRARIAKSLTGKESPYKGVVKVPRAESVCENALCRRVFAHEQYRNRKFCSTACAIRILGAKTTSSKASRGKAGIRSDISLTISFFSRWEANVARIYTHLGQKWMYAPKTFDIGGQRYTPDFYLPDCNTYVEVKNFWSAYSLERDQKFRANYPKIKLEVILKEDYLKLEKEYAHAIPEWEYRNSKF